MYTSQRVQQIRQQIHHLSQAAFARLLNVSPKNVPGWEQGLRHPAESAARLLQFIEQPELLTSRSGTEFRKADPTAGNIRSLVSANATDRHPFDLGAKRQGKVAGRPRDLIGDVPVLI